MKHMKAYIIQFLMLIASDFSIQATICARGIMNSYCVPCHASTWILVTSHFHSLSDPVCFPSGQFKTGHFLSLHRGDFSHLECYIKYKRSLESRTLIIHLWNHQFDEVVMPLQKVKASGIKSSDLMLLAGFFKLMFKRKTFFVFQ